MEATEESEDQTSASLTIDVKKAAVLLGVSVATVYEGCKRNEIPHLKIGRRIVVPRVAFERMLDLTNKGAS